MPELPDVTVYLDALVGTRVGEARRIGKRIVLAFDEDRYLVVHLMIAGRFRWRAPDARGRAPARLTLAELRFSTGTLLLTEAGTTRRASLHVVRGTAALAQFDRGGPEPLESTPSEFAERLRLENHTLKRALTDPRLFSGIGNAYSDEILHRALADRALSRLLREDWPRSVEELES